MPSELLNQGLLYPHCSAELLPRRASDRDDSFSFGEVDESGLLENISLA